ncbi:MAG: Adenylate cyclase [Candidatus Ozemobacter sibiricus]|uniref:Adenylate cyclase n=1 Tax=Candidatus Ozemobacter sibiricus TaxID=2268124 RepID=A0A367ZU63_9BACT|nr:MAG: Adenylate cyclase [Candidatus Ozemobacter sibiricus]
MTSPSLPPLLAPEAPRRWPWGEAALSIVLVLLFSLVSWFDLLDAFEVKTLDARFRHRRLEHIDDRIVLLYITDECIEKLGNWPWPRSLHAKAVDLLASAGARMVVFDVIFRDPDRTNPQEDESFIQACTKFGKVVFPLLIEQIRLLDPDSLDLRTEYEVARPFDRLASTALDSGFINVDYQHLNPDGIIRRLPLLMRDRPGGPAHPALDLAVARAALGQPLRLEGERLWVGETEVPQVDIPGLHLPWAPPSLPFTRALLINYLGPSTAGFFPTVFFSDLVLGEVDPGIFRDKIVLIGPSAVGLSDIKLTPYGEMPGVLIHANVLQNLLTGNFLREPAPRVQALLLVLLGTATFVFLAALPPLAGAASTLGLIVLYNGAAIWLFLRASIVLEMVAPTLLIILQYLGGRFWQLVRHLRLAYQSLERRRQELEQSNLRLDQQVRQLWNLNEASRRFASTLDMELLSREVLTTFLTIWEADDGLLAMVDTESDALTALQQSGFSGEDASLFLFDPAVAPLVGRLLEERRIISDPTGRWFTKYIPLLMGPKLWGTVLLRERNPQTRPEEQGDFWSTLAGLASTALENARLYNLATVDALTRLFVRRYFQVQIDQEFKRARRYHHRLALLMTDIDHFKRFNDTYGHQQGDIVLREVAGAVKRSLREIDIAARFGGEEFGIVLPETDLNGALIVGERIRRNVETLMVPRAGGLGDPLRVTISIGAASFPDHAVTNPEELVKLADDALYRAKQGGRNRVEVAPRTETSPAD